MVKKATRAPSAIRKIRTEAHKLFKTQIANAEERGYLRGINAAVSFTRRKRA